jgi:ribonuclease BN (tRNA processing enzyme)
VEVLERNPELRETKTLIMEASFLDDRVSRENARAAGHVHLDELIERVDLLPPEDVVLMHFSARHLDSEVPEVLRKRIPDELQERVRMLDNVTGEARSPAVTS